MSIFNATAPSGGGGGLKHVQITVPASNYGFTLTDMEYEPSLVIGQFFGSQGTSGNSNNYVVAYWYSATQTVAGVHGRTFKKAVESNNVTVTYSSSQKTVVFNTGARLLSGVWDFYYE